MSSGMSRNKRKYETAAATTYATAAVDPSSGNIFPPFHADCQPAFQLFPVGCLPEDSAGAGGFSLFSFDPPAGACDVCQTLACGHEEDGAAAAAAGWEACEHDTDWDSPTELQLEDILLSNLDFVYKNMVKTIASHGYSETAATNALLTASERYGLSEDVAPGIFEQALSLLKEGQDTGLEPLEYPAEELRKLEKALLDRMVALVCEAHPFFSIGDAMWCLLICDLNVTLACALDYEPSGGSANGDSSAAQTVKQNEVNSSDTAAPALHAESNVSASEKLSTMVPPSRYSTKSEICKALGIPNLPNGKAVISINAQVNSNTKSSENSVITIDHGEETTSTFPLQALKDGKIFISKKATGGGSRRDAVLRQKSINLEKNLRSVGTKAVIRAKHGSVGSVVLDRKSKSSLETASITLKSSSRIGKVIAANVTQAELSVDLSFSAGHPATATSESKSNGSLGVAPDAKVKEMASTTMEPKPSNCPPAKPVANTELSLSLPSSSIGTLGANEEVNVVDLNSSSATSSLPYIHTGGGWDPQDKVDEMALKLVPRVKDLQAQLQDWSDWAQQKVMQAARRLGKEKEELFTLRQEKEEVGRLHEERKTLEESTRKKLTEMESAISRATGQVERANDASRQLELENSHLRLEMEAAKVQAKLFATNCQELTQMQLKSSKKIQAWDPQKAQLQEEYATEVNKLARLNLQVAQAKELRELAQSKWRKEENSKNEAVVRSNVERKEKEQIETSARSQENSLLVNMENDVQRYKNEIRCLELQLSKLKMLDSSNMMAPKWCSDKSYASHVSERQKSLISANAMAPQLLDYDDIQRERECVMCLNAEMSVVFLPCAHQVVCVDCNALHEKQGMKDCPSCRTPIHRRICARAAHQQVE